MEQLLAHLFGDYILQSDWMAMNKSKRSWPCLVHVILYTSIFLLLTTSWKALLVIGITHYIIDRYPTIVKRLIWYKNHLGPWFKFVPYDKCDMTGYYDNIKNEIERKDYETSYFVPINRKEDIRYDARLNYITVWLYIITDNLLHLSINYMALKYLG